MKILSQLDGYGSYQYYSEYAYAKGHKIALLNEKNVKLGNLSDVIFRGLTINSESTAIPRNELLIIENNDIILKKNTYLIIDDLIYGDQHGIYSLGYNPMLIQEHCWLTTTEPMCKIHPFVDDYANGFLLFNLHTEWQRVGGKVADQVFEVEV